FVRPVLEANIDGFSRYPTTRGSEFLRQAIAGWLMRRYGLPAVDYRTQVLAAIGTREALFAVAHALVNPEAAEKPYVLMPNPMYQVYLGAAVTAGARPWLMPCTAATGFGPDWDAVPESVWAGAAMVYVCSPSNPTGWIASRDDYARLLELAEHHDFTIVADECYSEIHAEAPPPGLLEVAAGTGRHDFAHCLVMNSLSKRSALPGLRSGLIAGDARLIARFAKLRSYTGPATPLPLQRIAAAAWSDEAHVEAHLAIFRESLHAFYEAWGEGSAPAGSFFVWLPVDDDEAFARTAYEQQAVTVLPGSYLGAMDGDGVNPGAGYIRAALIDGPAKAAELARRLRAVGG
ncbi:MAG TPA: aminotransferase class I/II-fold pyridoxal phosphate-dependent enzyme, partial [Mariprofundaceae bacterium]|nr:aminotransferase class I/II-fold pyridoxal phosphate-dependent enzyme [Mariprofundaceae bacterium]